VLQFNVTAPDGTWVVDMAGDGDVREGSADEAAATFTLSDEDLAALVRGDDDAQSLYQRGNLRIDGDITFARKLSFMNELV